MATAGIVMALLPIGSLISGLTKELLNTAVAAQDVCVEKETFKTLARYLKDIQDILKDVESRNLVDSPGVRKALDIMKINLREATNVIQSTEGKSRFFLLIRSRRIVKSAQNATRSIGEAFQLLLAAGTEVAIDIGEHAHRLKELMVTAEFQASAAQTRVMAALERGLQEHKTDQLFANDILRQIAHAVEIGETEDDLKSELESFRREAEEVALRKQDQEKAFMEQVIAILYRAEMVSPPEHPIQKYRKLIQKASCAEGELPPYPAFICPLTKKVMEDPVILGGPETTYEKLAILSHLEGQAEGSRIDPESGRLLIKTELRPNNSLRASIEEWDALNKIIRIRAAKESLLCEQTSKQKDALKDLYELCKMKAEYKYWIAEEGVLEAILHLWTASSQVPKDVRELSLSTVTVIVTNIDQNKEKFVEAGGFMPVIKCMNMKYHRASAATLLMELCKNKSACNMLSLVKGAILSLVTVYFQSGGYPAVVENVKLILETLAEDDDNVEAMAMANWCDPLIKRLSTGPEDSRLFMANFLATKVRESDVNPENKKLLAEGAVFHLVTMLESKKFAVKMPALKALSNLSSWTEMKRYISEAGAVPLVLPLLNSSKHWLEPREHAALILHNLCSEDGVKYMVDVAGNKIPLIQIVEPLLAPQGLNSQSTISLTLRLATLRTLLGLVREKETRDIVREKGGVHLLLGLVWDSNREIRRSSLRLLMNLSENEGAKEVADELQRTQTEGALLKLLTDVDADAQASVAGILAHLPLDCESLKASFLTAGVVPVLVTLMSSEVEEVRANTLGALRQFTDSDIETQRIAANLEAHSRLIELLRIGSPRIQARAANVLRNFSLSTPKLVDEPTMQKWMCVLKSRAQMCRVHKGNCSVKRTFCLVEAGAISPLVSLLESDDPDNESGEAGEAALETLETLVGGDEIVQSGAIVLHEVHGIQPLFRLLTHKVHAERAVHMLEHIFKVPKMKEEYRRSASMPLKELASLPNNTFLRTRAARLLASIEIRSTSGRL